MKKLIAASLLVLALAGCGSKKDLFRPEGDPVPVKPATDIDALTSEEMITPSEQSRPERADEILRRSEKRQDDRFDLPPT